MPLTLGEAISDRYVGVAIDVIPEAGTSLEMDGTLDFDCFNLGAKK